MLPELMSLIESCILYSFKPCINSNPEIKELESSFLKNIKLVKVDIRPELIFKK